ncbi:MAG: 23S rRNA (guanosine(2251)-2'-O)-methyltransferase RlmB [Nitrospiraceae bacterium]|nr:23S rRNA (guanosine(2251)-2'-O)-methyltransferase RlmB [Nitrospiraceae bacterium]
MKHKYGNKPGHEVAGNSARRPDSRRTREEWVYGLNPVLEAIKSGRQVKSVFLSSSRREGVAGIEREVLSRGIELKKADQFFFDSRFPKGHQGIAAVVAQREYADFDEMLDIPSTKNELPFFLVLDCVEDPRNFGAVLRAADAGGVHGVVIQSHRSATLVPEAIKASAGAAEHIPVAMVSNIKHAMKSMREMGLLIVGAEAGMDRTIWDLDLVVPLALVIGSEGKGLRKTVREDCDTLASLPMRGKVGSLNVSVAAGIMIYEVIHQRIRKK